MQILAKLGAKQNINNNKFKIITIVPAAKAKLRSLQSKEESSNEGGKG
jgi:hypothetical protein